MSVIEQIDRDRLPQHVAIIMDGNGRWAKERGKDRSEGHREGVVSVRKVVEAATTLGLRYLTVYTFSMENWDRPEAEVHALMGLMVAAIHRETPDLMKNNVRLMAIGDLDRLPHEVRTTLDECLRQTSVNTGTTLVLALSYSSRWEILHAVKALTEEAACGQLRAEEVTEELFASRLTTRDIPDPDLLIRTGGEQRISNFLLWQLSYAELYFTEIYWPDFREEEFYQAIRSYQQRERRFGKTSDQLNQS
ncbi:di-trans,poly-cis-decaprenylcistransferase [Tannerella forsythia KS16]|jgi:undecaprenyl diphosphate synthase|uniref:isoprenyl transferase n=1 Tax=Tannerella forsythia TaxID=28112 RepID=UPI00059F92BC|nr:isoprenyl transferase [Tannerella forsythia]OLQ20219.1 di-trans,poly-cis-decaprenylcistransferase [Tannerella forsythia]BAR48848.1 di-trans,poly-cis-decaprenylcistransferase [Tannerella forsythia 3313]BAR51095.1 di-trans,poly-cis-decaprenylcistransferase [Tannerella forsythia KS16]SCQ21638.1 Isoprenyl transferase [Tannerella forsythia]